MKTTEEQNTQNMKTKIIGIPQCVASNTLENLSKNKISCEYKGIDESGRILMQISFEQSQEKLVQAFTDNMEEDYKSIILLLQIGTLAILDVMLKSKIPLPIRERKTEKLMS